MKVFNAIAKVRFSSSKAQRVNLADDVDLLCFEPGQKIHSPTGATYYVIAGSGQATSGNQTLEVPLSQMVRTEPDEAHTLENTGQVRLICLAIHP